MSTNTMTVRVRNKAISDSVQSSSITHSVIDKQNISAMKMNKKYEIDVISSTPISMYDGLNGEKRFTANDNNAKTNKSGSIFGPFSVEKADDGKEDEKTSELCEDKNIARVQHTKDVSKISEVNILTLSSMTRDSVNGDLLYGIIDDNEWMAHAQNRSGNSNISDTIEMDFSLE